MRETTSFGANPGQLRMLSYVPEGASALVVVLHGCTQSAEAYAAGAGWLALAERFGFAVLAPEQTPANNPNRCFNWFQGADTTRGSGEAASIAAMVQRLTADAGLDPARVFVTGLSAGGAMASVMLATYPELFAGGGIVAGLPHGAASSMPEAFEAMGHPRARSGAAWGDEVRQASTHAGRWPTVSVWHGGADRTVAPINADAIVSQWLDVHGLSGPAHQRRARHLDAASVDGRGGPAGCGVAPPGGPGARNPLATRGADGVGTRARSAGAGVSSSLEMARGWGADRCGQVHGSGRGDRTCAGAEAGAGGRRLHRRTHPRRPMSRRSSTGRSPRRAC
jgi:poly(hydroxyalkanoate) depolymerase family esterase